MAVVPTVTTAVAAVTTQWVAPTGQTAMYAIAFGKAAGLKPLSKDYRVPEGYGTADYIPTSRGHIIFIICAVTMGISVFVVVARIITRRIVTGWLGMEDYMMIPALLFQGALTTVNMLSVSYGGLGKHSVDMTYEEAELGIKCLVAHLLFYFVTIYFVKISILYFVRRLAGPLCTTTMKWVIYSFFIFHTTFAIACILTEVLQCKPILAAFDLSLRFRPDAICNDLTTFYWISSAIHACSDIASLALPMWMVIGMRMSWQKKLAVCFMFGLGGLSCVCSIVRMVYIDKWFHSDEISWDAYHPAIWGQLEGALAIIAASLPALKTLVARVIPGLLSSTNQSKGSSRGIERLKACSRTRDSLSDLFRLNSVVTEQRNATTTTLDTLDKKQTSIITGPIYAPVHRPFSQPPHTNPTLAVATSKERAISYSSYISDSDPLELPPMPRCKPSFGRESDRFDIEQEQRMNDYRYRETVERVERAERAARWK